MMRVRRNVTGALPDPDGVMVDLDHDREWADNDPIVTAHPDCFEPAKAPKKKAGT